MKLAYFPGCKIPYFLKSYGESFEQIMKVLGVRLVKLPFHCCGYPSRGEHFETSVFCAIKNFALARQQGLDIITPCKCCFGQLKHASYWYLRNPELKSRIDRRLAEEGLFWDGQTRIHHMLSFLHDDYGLKRLEKKMSHRFDHGRVAVQYGCHALRPFSITGFDHPYSPRIFESLVRMTGMEPVEWSKSTECCGNPVVHSHRRLSLKILENKFETARAAGAQYICSACTHCQMQYEMIEAPFGIQVVTFPRLLSASLGIEPFG